MEYVVRKVEKLYSGKPIQPVAVAAVTPGLSSKSARGFLARAATAGLIRCLGRYKGFVPINGKASGEAIKEPRRKKIPKGGQHIT